MSTTRQWVELECRVSSRESFPVLARLPAGLCDLHAGQVSTQAPAQGLDLPGRPQGDLGVSGSDTSPLSAPHLSKRSKNRTLFISAPFSMSSRLTLGPCYGREAGCLQRPLPSSHGRPWPACGLSRGVRLRGACPPCPGDSTEGRAEDRGHVLHAESWGTLHGVCLARTAQSRRCSPAGAGGREVAEEMCVVSEGSASAPAALQRGGSTLRPLVLFSRRSPAALTPESGAAAHLPWNVCKFLSLWSVRIGRSALPLCPSPLVTRVNAAAPRAVSGCSGHAG